MRFRPLVPALLLATLAASPAQAFMNPYVRIGFGGNQQDMQQVNEAIAANVGWAAGGGIPVTAGKVGAGYGPTVSAGLWLIPYLRVGGTWSRQRANVNHEYREVGFTYVDDYHFTVQEYGVEAAFRIPQLAGFTFGGATLETRAESAEDFELDNVHGVYFENWHAERTRRTYSVFAGLDQTIETGLAGFVHVGYHWRDMGPMSGTLRVNDNGTITETPGETVPMDYSGWSVRLGLGFDLKKW